MSACSGGEIGILCSSFERGGVERNLVNFASGLSARGHSVTLLIAGSAPGFLWALPNEARVEHTTKQSVSASLERYIAERRPCVLLCAKHADEMTALALMKALKTDTRLAFLVGTNLSRRMLEKPLGWLRYPFHARALSRHYRSADVVLANSRGVADDLVKTARLPRERVHIVPNPVVGSILYELAEQPVSHPWLASKERPVLIAGGRLAGVKDYPTLLRALALLKAEGSSVRLIVLGEGGHRARLSRLASRLGIADRTHLVGHTDNAYAYIARADGVVLSSRREGNPNVLIEAMALGTPVASTDCPSGPRELLHGGVLGPLVPVGDWRALARAMAQILADPVPRRRLQAAAQAFTVDASTDALQCALAVAGRS